MAGPTFQDLMRAAVNADAAGDEAAARELVGMARSMRDGAAPEQAQTEAPRQSDATTMLPRAYDPDTDVETQRTNVFGDTTSKAVAAPLAATKAFAAGVMDQDKSPTMANMPDWMPKAARGPAALAGDVAMTGLSAVGTAYAAGAGGVAEIIAGDQTQERKLARDLMMMGEVAVPELAGVSSVNMAASKAARAASKLNGPQTDLQRGAKAADEMGITPSLGAGGKTRALAASTLEKVPGSGGLIQRDATRFVGEVESAFEAITKKVGPATGAADAGAALQGGLNKFVTNFKAKSGELYDNVGTHIPSETKISATETVAAIREMAKVYEGNPAVMKELGINRWIAIADDLENGMSWKAAIDLRSSIGKSIGKMNGPLKDMDQGRMNLAYGRLTDDLEAAAKAAGPEAEKAWKRANNHYSRGAKRISNDLDKTIKADSPERAFEAFANMAKEGRSSADARRIFTIKASMPKSEWRQVSASIIDRLGKSPAGVQNAAGDAFSPGRFLTEWNKMTPEARSALLPGDARKEMTKLAEVAELSKSANAERNFSNTGNVVVGAGIGAGAYSAPITTSLALGSAWGSAKMLTNPAMLRALNKAARGDTRALNAIAKSNSPLAQDARTVLRMSAAESAAGPAAANSQFEPTLKTATQN